MFSNTVQPSIVSLFSSTSSEPLQLFSQHVDPSPVLRSDSFIHLLNDTTSLPHPPVPGVLIQPTPINSDDSAEGTDPKFREKQGRTLCQTVLHIQSPTIRTTYIRCPPSPTPASFSRSSFISDATAELGLTLPWVHLQVRSLGREWAFEVCVADRAGKRGVIKCSTFQKEATLKCQYDPPLLHVPLRFPSASSRPLTAWSTVSLDLRSMIHQFGSIGAAQQADFDHEGAYTDDEKDGRRTSVRQRPSLPGGSGAGALLPSGTFGKVLYVKVYASCRVRRIWFSEDRRGALPSEFQLYSSSQA
ncbi:hypothetical protein DFH11DRAFT_1290162 [Phellopilus nigrolimitatus]|nr:hypothetical protein DFH11DRAFT_1290162 [Phellopilus nigrolimitatus]